MIKSIGLSIISLAIIMAGAAPASTMAVEGVRLSCPAFTLGFLQDGSPELGGSAETAAVLAASRDTGGGFHLTGSDGSVIPLTVVQGPTPDTITARSSDGAQQVVFKVHRSEKYIALRIERLFGIPDGSPETLHFEMREAPNVHVTELDYMTEANNYGYADRVDWSYLWHRSAQDPLGGFAIYTWASDDDEDNTLLKIWVEEKLTHPKIKGQWNLARARQWIVRWQKTFAANRQFILEAATPQELYAATPYIVESQTSEVYLFTNCWNSDGFWPISHPAWDVCGSAFPGGEADLRKYADYLNSRGIRLALHYVSGGIGPRDPVYVGSKPDRRLAAWGSGVVTSPVSAMEKNIPFLPDTGTNVPIDGVNPTPYDINKQQHGVFDVNYFRVGDEIVRAGAIEKSAAGDWWLRDCTRGLFLTKAAAHAAGEKAVGLFSAYGQVFIPDNDSTLLDETAAAYAGMINRCHIDHTEYDGAEIHVYNGLWGYQKYAARVYANLDHPVTAHDSSGSAPRAFFEYRLNSTQGLMRGFNPSTDGNWSVPIEPASNSREASKLLDAQFVLSQGHQGDMMGVAKPEPMFGVTADMLKNFGLTETMIQTLLEWRQISHLLSADQHTQIDSSLAQPTSRMPEHSGHLASSVVYCARKMAAANTYECIPVSVLTREKGDIQWQIGQEHGPIEPKQYIKPEDSLTLINPNTTQEPHFIIRVLSELNANSDSANISIQPDASEIHGNSSISVTQERPNVLRLSADNPTGAEVWNVNDLPVWNRSLDMSSHRAIGMDITGDGSGAVLTLEIPGRDYVFPIDFTGKRHLEVPNGEAAWSSGDWGWRMATKWIDYSHVSDFKLGFGYLPPHSNASVLVENISALNETPSALVNPVIHVGSGSLTVDGQVPTDDYLEYDGGDTASLYDANWHKLADPPVSKSTFIFPSGQSNVSVTSSGTGNAPWMEFQMMTEGTPMVM